MVAHAFNPSTEEAEAGGSLWVRGQPDLQELVRGQEPKTTENPCLEKSKKEKKKKKEKEKKKRKERKTQREEEGTGRKRAGLTLL